MSIKAAVNPFYASEREISPHNTAGLGAADQPMTASLRPQQPTEPLRGGPG